MFSLDYRRQILDSICWAEKENMGGGKLLSGGNSVARKQREKGGTQEGNRPFHITPQSPKSIQTPAPNSEPAVAPIIVFQTYESSRTR